MEAMACAIAPAAEELDIGFTQGSLRITVQEGTIGSIAVACSGTMSIMRSAAEVSLATEITLVQETGAFQVPDQVVQVLKQEIE